MISQYLNLPLTSFAKATSSVLSLKSPSRMDPTIVRPRPKKNTALSKDNFNIILRLRSQRVNVFTLNSSHLPDLWKHHPSWIGSNNNLIKRLQKIKSPQRYLPCLSWLARLKRRLNSGSKVSFRGQSTRIWGLLKEGKEWKRFLLTQNFKELV